MVAVAACALDQLNYEGLSCNDVRPCPEGYSCVRDLCTSANDAGPTDAGPVDAGSLDAGRTDAGRPDASVNLVGNPGFEQLGADGGFVLWRRVFSETTLLPNRTARRGTYSGQLEHSGANFPMVISLPTYGGPDGGLKPSHGFCSAVWARTVQNTAVRVYLSTVEVQDDGNGSEQAGRVSEEVTQTWTRISTPVAIAYKGLNPAVAVQVWTGASDPAKTVLIDDAELWMMKPDASCP